MAGYHGYSMSNNAVRAYDMGRKPKSKWTKTALLEYAKEYLTDEEDPLLIDKMKWLRSCRVDDLQRELLQYKEWHHSSSFYNMVDFYGVNETILDELTEELVNSWHTEKPVVVLKERRKGNMEYLEWTGPLTRRKAITKRLRDVYIEEKGAFYYVYSEAGEFLLKKKRTTKGVYVSYAKDNAENPSNG